MPEPIALTTSPAIPTRSGPTLKSGDVARGEGNGGLALTGASVTAEGSEVSFDPVSSQKDSAQAGGFEQLLFAQLAMIEIAAADFRDRGIPATVKSGWIDDAPAERTSEPDVVAAVLAETSALAIATPPQIAPAVSRGNLPTHTQHQVVPTADPSEPETSDGIPIPAQVTNQVIPSLNALIPDQAESSPARGTPPHAAAPVEAVDGHAPAADRHIAPARPDGTTALRDPERNAGKPEMPAQHLENAPMAAPAPAQTDHVPELPPRIDVLPALDSRSAAAIPVIHVTHPLASPEWKREFGTQVTLFVSRNESQAEIRVNPPELGPVEVRIGFDGDKISVAFAATPADTRQAIQDALPQLRELLAERGLSLGNATVGAESSPRDSTPTPRFAAQQLLPENTPAREHQAVHLTHRLVDTFA